MKIQGLLLVAVLTITEATAQVGDTIHAAGTGYTPDEDISFTFNGVAIAAVEGTITSDGSGDFTASFVVPAVPQGTRTLVGTDESLSTDDDTVDINPKITLSPTTANPGDTVTITGSGFAASEDITSTFDSDPLTTDPATPATGANGSFTATFEVPDVIGGTYAVECTDESTNSESANLTVISVPAAPVLTLGTVTDISLRVTCPAPDDGDSPILGYTFEISVDNFATILDTITTETAGAQDVTFEDLTQQTTYKIRARATNAIGDSDNSNIITQATDKTLTQLALTLGGLFGENKLDSYLSGKLEGVTVNSDTDIDICVVPMHGAGVLLLHFKNPHATRDVTYTCYGTGEELTTPKDFDTGVWEAISGATGTIGEGANVSKTISTKYAWVLVRAKRAEAGQNTALSTYARATRN